MNAYLELSLEKVDSSTCNVDKVKVKECVIFWRAPIHFREAVEVSYWMLNALHKCWKHTRLSPAAFLVHVSLCSYNRRS